jgi:hypothetical protein
VYVQIPKDGKEVSFGDNLDDIKRTNTRRTIAAKHSRRPGTAGEAIMQLLCVTVGLSACECYGTIEVVDKWLGPRLHGEFL